MVNFLLAGEFIAGAVIAILVISNPVSTSAIFISLTQEMTHEQRIAVVKRSVRYSIGIMIFFSLTGFLLFKIFGFSIGAFRIAGGVLLFSTAISMLEPRPTEKVIQYTSQDIALIPLSIPFTTGPGTIVTIIIWMTEAQNIFWNTNYVTGSLAISGVYIGMAVTLIVSYTMMSRSEDIDKRLGEGGRRVITRLMGLLVMAIAIQFVINGIKDILPDFVEVVSNNSTAFIGLI